MKMQSALNIKTNRVYFRKETGQPLIRYSENQLGVVLGEGQGKWDDKRSVAFIPLNGKLSKCSDSVGKEYSYFAPKGIRKHPRADILVPACSGDDSMTCPDSPYLYVLVDEKYRTAQRESTIADDAFSVYLAYGYGGDFFCAKDIFIIRKDLLPT